MADSSLVDDLRDAIRIEISTIPLYLFAMYSIKQDKPEDKDGAGAEARAKILTVVQQEMLHLALAGNLKTAAGEAPILYNNPYFPTYGGESDKILKSKIPLNLDRCKKESLKTFVQIEAPWAPPPPSPPSQEGAYYTDEVRIALKDESIGQFYRKLEHKIDTDSNDFKKDENMQFSKDSGFDDMVTITDKASAKKALRIIIDQGEGSVGVKDAHYQMFLDLFHNHEQWSCWNVMRNPKKDSKAYKDKPLIKELNDAFNAAYCYLLLVVSKVWHTGDAFVRRKLFGTNHSTMVNVLSPLADLLVSLPLSTGTNPEYAAPTFEKYYPKGGTDITTNVTAEQIDGVAGGFRDAVKTHINEAKKHTQKKEEVKLLETVLLSIERASWP